MISCVHYESLEQEVKETCIVCRGTGVFRDEHDFERECPCCHGEGELEVELRECPHCHSIVARNVLIWVNDRYGIPYKHVCYDCYEEVYAEISGWKFDETICGESLEEEPW